MSIEQTIASICRKTGQNPREITLVGVTKYASAEQISKAVEAGITHIGENKVQAAKEKFAFLDNLGIKPIKHMIGHLQTNKVKQALELFDLIQSVESLKLAKEISNQADKTIPILLQVNTAREPQKFGITPNETLPLLNDILKLPRLRVEGLMTMAPFTEDTKAIRQCFRDLKNLYETIKKEFPNDEHIKMKYLSMGMSMDYTIALEEGSNMLRIGSAIFK